MTRAEDIVEGRGGGGYPLRRGAAGNKTFKSSGGGGGEGAREGANSVTTWGKVIPPAPENL